MASPFDALHRLHLAAPVLSTNELLEMNEDMNAAGLLVGLFADARSERGLRGARASAGPEMMVGHVIQDGACFEGLGTATALRDIYESAFSSRAAIGAPGPCPRAAFGGEEAPGAYISLFKVPAGGQGL